MVYNREWFINRIAEKRPGHEEYELVSDYVNAHTKVRFIHKVCGDEIEITPNSFMNGRGCIKCGRKRARQKQIKSLEEVYQKIPSSLVLMDAFVSVVKPNQFKCKDCGSEFKATIHDLERQTMCSYCKGTNRETTDTFSTYVHNETNGEYELVGEYTVANSYVVLKHVTCGNIYKVTPHNFKHGKRCAKCKSSTGERFVRSALEDMGVQFEEQKKFSDLILERHLSYDFFIPDRNILIEYQGLQHYESREFFGGDDSLKLQRRRDNIKRQYANKNGYTLIEIPYTINSTTKVVNYLKDQL